jgi:hypothetical protein
VEGFNDTKPSVLTTFEDVLKWLHNSQVFQEGLSSKMLAI